ncbi:Transcription accessory protein (S1 RNA-binding domain) [hydrothermal vent metagenome]|uniref:Transcription accessory protein (S1 RNA-binding domain) n=1 Tax=hydrothermal vent metagenome TaxID=652676 RepID=A0A3B1CVM3_9ZZZZ
MNIPKYIADELQLREEQVINAAALFAEDATVPFIARYRKEKTGGLDEDQLREIEDKLNYYELLQDRKETILKSIEEQGKLTEELRKKIENSVKLREIEDLYLPYKPKRKTRGTVAKAKGLEPLADLILNRPNYDEDFEAELSKYIDEEKGVNSAEEALQGAKDIIAEMISDNADVREVVRNTLLEHSMVQSIKAKEKQNNKNKKDVYDIYHDFKIEITRIKPYQTLALNRGEKEGFLKVSLGFNKDDILSKISETYFSFDDSVFMEILEDVVNDSFTRLISPSIEREVRNYLTEIADMHAIEVFAANLRQLLLQPPILNKTIIGIDPGFVSGSKVAVIDSTGKYLEGATVYPHPPQKKMTAAKETVLKFIKKYSVDLIAIGNGTASRETEIMIANLIKENNLDCHYLIVNEAGASVYSASPVAKQEFPDLEASQRGNISIARRVLDPLAELVKIDAKSIGVGLYQHDVDQKLLRKNLDVVVDSCVNFVGVDINTASASLLTYVSGLNSRLAKNIVAYRENNGKFKSRKEILKVTGIGEKSFEQSAGFLKISQGVNSLDSTFIHPESYSAAEKLLESASVSLTDISRAGPVVKHYVDKNGLLKSAEELGIGEPTLLDIVENLLKPGRDPREEMPKPILRSDVLKMEDLTEGMKLLGTVRNVVDFGAFVDIGVKQDALLHISQMANKYIKNPLEIINVGDIVEVTVIGIDIAKGRISISMKSNIV